MLGVIILVRVLVLKVCSDWRNMIMNEMAIQKDLEKARLVLVCLWWCCRWWWLMSSFLLCSSCCTKKVGLIWDFSPSGISSSGPLGSYLPSPRPRKNKVFSCLPERTHLKSITYYTPGAYLSWLINCFQGEAKKGLCVAPIQRGILVNFHPFLAVN